MLYIVINQFTEVRPSQLAQASERVGSPMPASQQGRKLCRRLAKKTRASGRNISKVFNPVVKLVLENQPFLIQFTVGNMSSHSYSVAMGKL